MKKIFYFLLAVFLVVGCSDQFGINGPDDNNNNNNNNNNGTNENPNAIEYTYSGTVNYSGPIAADPIFISRETVGSSTVEHYKLTWSACPFNPNIPNVFGISYIRLSIPHVDKNHATVYYNGSYDANYYFENVDQDWIYFKVISLPNQTLKMNIAIKTVNATAWNANTCKWFHKILPDDGQNNIYTLLIQ